MVVAGADVVDQVAQTKVVIQVGPVQLRAEILREILLMKAEATLVLDTLIQGHFVNFLNPSLAIICKKVRLD
jgi:hypothetical protein